MSPGELFWAGQLVYIKEVFLPIIIGVLVFVPVLVVFFAFGFWRHLRLWKAGQPDNRTGNVWQRLGTTLAVAFANIRIIRQKELYPGIMHTCIGVGTLLLVLGKLTRLVSYLTSITVPPQSIYLYASLIAEIGGVLIIVGGIMAIIRRYIVRPTRLDNKPDDSLVYVWVGLILLTGFMIKGYRIAIGEVSPTDWALWSPVGYLLSHIFPTFLVAAKNEILVWHRVIIHTVPAFILLVYICINRSRLQHILLSPLNIFFRSLGHRGIPATIDIEKTEHFGTSVIQDFTWKNLMDLDACTRCGRCQDNCPAHLSGKPLSPKKVIQDLKTHLQEQYPGFLPIKTKADNAAQPAEGKAMIGDVISLDAIWNCTTCYACQEVCPVCIEPMAKIIEMRRNLVMEQASVPETGEGALKSLEARSHPWRGTTFTRTDWTQGLDIKTLSADANVDILFWVGCTEALEERSTKVAQAVAKILKASGINFGILGDEEACCGDPARRLGNEYLYQMIAQQNIEIFKNYNVKKIITACPHCYNNLKYEYPQFGGNYEVIHHTDFIAGLLKEGKLKLKKGYKATVTYHDSCYLGRYNNIYSAPRQILKSVPDLNLVEMARNKKCAFCCGAGGGHMWMEEQKEGQRINDMRTEQAIAVKAQTIATACPFCLQMFGDGVKSKGVEETMKLMDIAEIIAQSALE